MASRWRYAMCEEAVERHDVPNESRSLWRIWVCRNLKEPCLSPRGGGGRAFCLSADGPLSHIGTSAHTSACLSPHNVGQRHSIGAGSRRDGDETALSSVGPSPLLPASSVCNASSWPRVVEPPGCVLCAAPPTASVPQRPV
ncbi:hypothetical protein EYF80_053454 [Liparis tanakae]|uniref:Uncharacterized protein n=1 Tax=Liparis tanakae TaxID=230148 RepID=A0A4Z2F6C3_9TELE|nr:hypothetical protein EYF80_053454 [Liparis tanakae]